MGEKKRPIFRVDAIRRYSEGREKAVLPRIIRPRTFLCLWLLLALVTAVAGVVWSTRVPVFTSGAAVIVPWQGRTPPASGDVAVAAFVPAAELGRLRVGQAVLVQIGGGPERLPGSIIAVAGGVLSPDEARRAFALDGSAGLVVSQPSAVAVARLDRFPPGVQPGALVSSLGQIQIAAGSRRVSSLLPLVGKYLGG
ncbi:MAG: HlyD family efflux transporter periplasmic adaptor subunit [Thermomicrobiaceae bacterium]|nr:HlyD family efflux transporter periplasmic adaptor subunit [Thermomicrobiaceae bacterium]